jgi:adenylate kinase
MEKIAIVIYGSPGSGKGTQAEKIAQAFDLIHFDTGKIIEKTVHDPKNAHDPIVQEERRLFDTGFLTTPPWTLNLVLENIKKIHSEGRGIVFSGSPRTEYEAEGDKKEGIPGVIETLEKYYGRENIFFLRLNVSRQTAIYRNIHRRICEKCRFILQYSPENEKLDKCPQCGGKLVRRSLDTADVMKVRLEEYGHRTKPIFDFVEARGYKIIDIDGEPEPDAVARDINEKLSEFLR